MVDGRCCGNVEKFLQKFLSFVIIGVLVLYGTQANWGMHGGEIDTRCP